MVLQLQAKIRNTNDCFPRYMMANGGKDRRPGVGWLIRTPLKKPRVIFEVSGITS